MRQTINKNKGKMYSGLEKKRCPYIYLCILLPVVQFIIFWGYVNIDSVLLAFQNRKGEFVLDNFVKVFNAFSGTDDYGFNVGTALKHSVTLWFFSEIVVYPIAVVSTYVLFKKVWGHYVFRTIFTLPGIIGSVIWVSVMRYMVAWDGPVLSLFSSLGIEMSPLVLDEGLLGSASTAFDTLIALSLIGVVGGSVVLTGAFSRIPTQLFESARIDGCGFWREFFNVALPCVGGTIATTQTFALCSFFVADCNVYLYTLGTGEPDVATMGFYFYYLQNNVATAGLGKAAYNYPAALGITISLMSIPIVYGGRWLLDKYLPAIEF